MPEAQSRRRFIKTVGASALIAGLGGAPPTVLAKELASVGSSNVVPLSRAARALLDAAAETLIPASDGMPSARDVTVGDHLERLGEREPSVRDSLERALSRLEGFSRTLLPTRFAQQDPDSRVATLQAFERAAPSEFKALWQLVCEAYYVNPRVLALMGHQLALTNQFGIQMTPLDPRLLDRVRRMPARYREVPDAR
jgi:hypothetical protein